MRLEAAKLWKQARYESEVAELLVENAKQAAADAITETDAREVLDNADKVLWCDKALTRKS